MTLCEPECNLRYLVWYERFVEPAAVWNFRQLRALRCRSLL
jgi:hypothetical protein